MGLEKSNLFLRTKKVVFLWKKNQICFVIYIYNQICILKKIKSVFICVNNIKKKIFFFLRRGLYSWNKSILHALNKQTKPLMTPFFISKSVMLKKSNLYLSKIQSVFIFKKFRFASNEDTDLFLIWEKFKFEPNEDADESFIWENFRSASNEDAYPFFI